MARIMGHKDVAIIGFGMTGIMAAEELSRDGHEIVALERGAWRDTIPDFSPTFMQDELRFGIRHALHQQPVRETVTFRNNGSQEALPMRRLGSFLPGTGVGGSLVHWNGQCWRFLPSDFTIRSHYTERYGADFIPEDMTVQDWGVTYDDLEPFYDKFEYLLGISGRAGHVKGVKQDGGNPFEGPRSRDYPNPPLKRTYATTLFDQAARDLGLDPFPCPAGQASQPYTNPLGVTMGACSYCGYCERFGCGNYSKSTMQTTVLPALRSRSNIELRTLSEVTRIVTKSGRATGVEYTDIEGNEYFQPADLVLLCAYPLHNVRLLLNSEIGEAYDPDAATGQVGRNYAYQIVSSVGVTFKDKILNPFIGSGALGQVVDNYNGDNFDHRGAEVEGKSFVGGGYIALYTTGSRPISTNSGGGEAATGGAIEWGSDWKRKAAESYLHSATIITHGSVQSHRGNYLSRDERYTDHLGHPLMRMTFDFTQNEHEMSDFLTGRAKRIAEAMQPDKVSANPRQGHYSIVPYQTTHNTGGAIMGTSPDSSVVNIYGQSWQVPNLFVFGASMFPQNAGYNPTGTVGALLYFGLDRMRAEYFRNPGPLVQA